MSLLNQMLRDLDRREASSAERTGLAAQVKALPTVSRFSGRRALLVLVGLAGVLGIVAGVWQVFESQPSRVASAPAPRATAATMMEGSSATATEVAVPPAMPVASTSAAVTPPPVAHPAVKIPPSIARVVPSTPVTTEPVPGPAPAPVAAPDPAAERTEAPRTETAAVAIDRRARVSGGEGADATGATGAAETLYRQAVTAHRQGRSSEAISGLQNALAADGRHVAARQALLSLLIEQRRWLEAQTVASAGLAIDPSQSGWAMALARLQLEQGQVADAEQTMAHHAGHGERNPDYQAFHGLLLRKLQRPADAVERFRAATRLRPDEGRWWYGLGTALDANQQSQDAREAFVRARDCGNLPPELAAAVESRLR